ncbi:hypothetical protein QVD17_24069 [Tagetes erecta]|uniref:EF-hand domain-containing protein n=1 Tax=Tagetes erecta TaxID=13708 RepID=A0AAD8KL52_TARER|nr:hypothetical protein QVD17_24069 [Tagetes erecta]
MCPTNGASKPAIKPADLRSAFDILDVDRDGKISHNDLKTLYTDAGDDDIGTMMSLADLNKDGYVEYEEFEKVVNDKKGGVMEDVFNCMDRDGDGKVGEDDLKSYFKFVGIEVDDDDIKAMVCLGSGDDDDNGVSFEGFIKILAI